jgi:hypothetical protein
MDPATFLRMMREMRDKTGTPDHVSLFEWAKRQINGVDERINRPERDARLA